MAMATRSTRSARPMTEYGVWIILLKGLTPIPYKIVTITSGFAGYNLLALSCFSVIARGMRFYLLAFLLHRYGERARQIIEERLGLWYPDRRRGPRRRHRRRGLPILRDLRIYFHKYATLAVSRYQRRFAGSRNSKRDRNDRTIGNFPAGPFAAFATALVSRSPDCGRCRALAQLNVQPPQHKHRRRSRSPRPCRLHRKPLRKRRRANPRRRRRRKASSTRSANGGINRPPISTPISKKMKTSIDEANERNAKASARRRKAPPPRPRKPPTRCRNCRPRASSRASRLRAGAERIARLRPAAKDLQGQGFQDRPERGYRSARKCSARALLTRNESSCTNETIVTRAACQ